MREPRLDLGRRREAHAPVHALDEAQRAFHVRRGEERQGRIVAARPVPVGEARFFLLQVRRVPQQDLEQIGGAARAIHGTAEAVPDEPRQVARVIDVRVAQDDGGKRAGIERRRAPSSQAQGLEPLEEPAVEQEPVSAVLEQMLGAVTVPPARPRKVRVAPEVIGMEYTDDFVFASRTWHPGCHSMRRRPPCESAI